VTSTGRRKYQKRTPQETLIAFLKEYQPAVTVFSWTWGEALYPELREIKKYYNEDTVMPATGFDNGAMVFHSSIEISLFHASWEKTLSRLLSFKTHTITL
jgi:hypothetical protein